MIIRVCRDFDLTIESTPIHAVRIYDNDYIIEFHGIKLEWKAEEISKLKMALEWIQTHPRDSLVFNEKGEMMKWYYDRNTNHGGAVELNYDSSKQINIDDEKIRNSEGVSPTGTMKVKLKITKEDYEQHLSDLEDAARE